MVFTSESVNEATDNINDGVQVKRYQNPWLNSEVGLRRAGVVFKMTAEEQEEYVRCAMDVHYFTENYCKVKTEDGSVGSIKLRDYQSEILDMFNNNRFSILMAARQCGKCNDLTSTVLVYDNLSDSLIETPLYKIYYKYKKNKTIYDRIKYALYNMIYKLK